MWHDTTHITPKENKKLMTLDGELVLIGTVFLSMLILHWVNRKCEENVERNEEECKQLEIDSGITTHIYTQRRNN